MSDKDPEDVLNRQIERTRTVEFVVDDDGLRLREMEAKYDGENFVADCPSDEKTKSVGTRTAYLKKLIPLAKQRSLTETTADQWNQLFMDMKKGRADWVKDSGLSNSSISLYQNALRAFLKTVDGATPTDIALASQDDSPVDPEDMLTRDDIRTVREVADEPRNLALFDFFIYTGQRNTAARTVRIGDLKLEENKFRLNENALGLKGADENGTWRSLLLSEASIRTWLQTGHPAPNDDDAYVFTPLPKYAKVDPHEPLSAHGPPRIMRKLKEKADIDKPMNPHNLRHCFVTIAKRRGMSDTAIKHQIGHAASSNVMESTYAHLHDEDHIRDGQEAFGIEVDEEESFLTPETCPRCGASPDENAKLCGVCQLPFSPGIKSTRQAVNESILQDAKDFNDDEIHDALDDLRDLLRENPGLFDALTGDE